MKRFLLFAILFYAAQVSAISLEIKTWPKWALVKWFGVEEKVWHRLPEKSLFLLPNTDQIWAEAERRQSRHQNCPIGMRKV